MLFDRLPQHLADGYESPGTALGSGVVERNVVCNLTASIEHHRPFQSGDFLCSQAGVDRKQEDEPVAGGLTAGGDVRQNQLLVGFAQYLRLFTDPHALDYILFSILIYIINSDLRHCLFLHFLNELNHIAALMIL